MCFKTTILANRGGGARGLAWSSSESHSSHFDFNFSTFFGSLFALLICNDDDALLLFEPAGWGPTGFFG